MDKYRESKIKLTVAVKRHECIWNLKHANYGCRFHTKEAWRAVLKELDPSWENKPKLKQECQLKDTQRQWLSIRSYYRKSQNNGQIKGFLKEKSASYLKLLTFLDSDVQENINNDNTRGVASDANRIVTDVPSEANGEVDGVASKSEGIVSEDNGKDKGPECLEEQSKDNVKPCNQTGRCV